MNYDRKVKFYERSHQNMANRINVKLILELKSGGMSQNEIARTRHMSRTSVSTVVNIAKEKSISFEDIRDLNDDVIYRMFFPEKMLTEDMYELPDYEYVHKELRRVGVTLKLLWKNTGNAVERMVLFRLVTQSSVTTTDVMRLPTR